jgi:alpha-tubulin suppressor-like RCC1 family protein
MERRTNLSIHHLWALNQYFEDLCTVHYPREIIQIIICLYYNLFKIKIKCSPSYNHCMILFDGEIYSWGRNFSGELGLGFFDEPHDNPINIPTKINLPHITKISCGSDFSLAVDQNNILYGWGNNYNGELGLGEKPVTAFGFRMTDFGFRICSPRIISEKFFIKKIITSHAHSMILTNTGEIYGWGQNCHNQLNLDSMHKDIKLPRKLNFTDINKLVGGNHYSIALSTSNELFSWGETYNAFPIVDFIKEYSYLSNIIDIVSGSKYCAIIIGDDIHFWGSFFGVNHLKLTFPNLKKLTCGNNHFMILSKSGEVYAQYWNKFESVTGMDSLEKIYLPPIKKIVCGDGISFAISILNDIYVWGHGYGNEPKKLIL